MKWIMLILALGLISCANNNQKRYEYNPSGRCSDIFCLTIAIAKSMSHSEFKKCSEMSGNKRKSCDSQVESLKKHIRDASEK
ncbi:hypothetical protein [Colwellia sp. PAMC 20917]|uniref:hypothetical protein n=1 Tax=Colwellia sp. PAMC 20917 TaxID=1816218 RepID=UPI0009F39E5D|nr:hypothetical protein [Colwellia sp. PAMC 20917]